MMNGRVLMSGAEFFSVIELNPYSQNTVQPNRQEAVAEHLNIQKSLQKAGIEVVKVNPPEECQDGVYTANWALCHGGKAILANLPNARKKEEQFAKKHLEDLGLEIIKAPYLFSGQGDALIVGNRVIVGQNYRTDMRMYKFIEEHLGLEVIGVETVPRLNAQGEVVTNAVTGLADSFFYDLDLAMAIISDNLIAWCPDAFTPESQEKLRGIKGIAKIEVSIEEAKNGFACNLVSTGRDVIMSSQAPLLAACLENYGLKVTKLDAEELSKGGGFIRCCSLTLG